MTGGRNMSVQAKMAAELAKRIAPLLVGQPPEVVGAALAETCATFFAGHAPGLRAFAKAEFAKLTDDLIPIIVELMIEAGRAPQDWRQ